MHGHRQKRREDYIYYSYECSTRVKTKQCSQHSVERDRIETAVCDYVRQLLSPQGVEKLKQYLLEHLDLINQSTGAELLAYEKDLKNIKRKIDKTLDLLIEMPSEALKKKLQDMENRQLFLESKIYELKNKTITPETIEKALIICTNFDELSREDKQEIIRKVIKKVTISKDGDQSCTIIGSYSQIAQLYWRCHRQTGTNV